MYGILNLSLLGYLLSTLILTQITIAAVTIYLHRCQSHRALTLHPSISHFFRLWLWLATGMVTKEWVAIHRKHHAFTEKDGDPHSPVLFGIKKILFSGAEVYKEACKDEEMIKKYSHGTPDDWLERNIYSRFSGVGIFIMLLIDLLLFGVGGITIWAIQMIWIPFWAAGVVNGIGHYWGYRNFECYEAATNIIPWGFWIGGEELHNNHHAYASSAKFSAKWWEFDLGYFYIRILSLLKLAKIKKLPPKLTFNADKKHVDVDTVRAVVASRLFIMAKYYKDVIRPLIKQERRVNKSTFKKKILINANNLFKKHENLLSKKASNQLNLLLKRYDNLREVYNYRQSLQNIWLKTAKSQKELVDALQNWCKQAENSGLDVLRKFSNHIKCYQLKNIHI